MMKRILPFLLLLLALPAVAQEVKYFEDFFQRADQMIEADADWTKIGGTGGSQLAIVSNVLNTTTAAGGRRAYLSPDQGVVDLYAEALVPALTGRSNNTLLQVVVRFVDVNNYIGVGVSQANLLTCGIRTTAGGYVEYASLADPGADVIALKITATGDVINCFYDNGAGWTEFHEQTAVSDHIAATRAGFVSNLGVGANVPTWDNYETGSTTAPDVCVGTECVIEIFDLDADGDADDDDIDIAFLTGTTYYINPASGAGTGTGLSNANAFVDAGDVNTKDFNPGDQLVIIEDTAMTLGNDIDNKTMIGNGTNDPFFFGVYHMSGGTPVRGLSGGPYTETPGGRGCLDGMDYDNYNFFDMDNTTIMAMKPTPTAVSGTFQQGTQNGLLQFFSMDSNRLHIWIKDICVRASGGKGIRMVQSGAAHGGFLAQNIYVEGSMKQSMHFSGAYDVLVEDSWFTLSDGEHALGTQPGNTQGQLTTKGLDGDPDTPNNLTFRQNVIWDSFASECMNSNSGNKFVIIEDNVCVDTGKVHALYLDRTFGMIVRRNIVIRDGRSVWLDFDGATVEGRGADGIVVMNEKSSNSFPWIPTYSTEADYFLYQTQQSVIEFNIVIGYKENYSFLAQASTAADGPHLGRAHGAGIYWYNNMSLDPAAYHYSVFSGAGQDEYVLRTDYPQRMWANMFWNGNTQESSNQLVDRNDPQFEPLWTNNYVSNDITAGSNFNQAGQTAGITMPMADYWNLAAHIPVTADGNATYDGIRTFLEWMGVNPDDLTDKDLIRFKPTANVDSGINAVDLTYPPLMTYGEQQNIDIEHNPLPANLYFGPFQTIGEAPEASPSLLLKRRRVFLEPEPVPEIYNTIRTINSMPIPRTLH